ncbi:MAG TPA: hypothetical protein ENK83_01220 [Aliiroseovarius sp.]|nr:hypothetical protein [Aliiroseovarius sp.]
MKRAACLAFLLFLAAPAHAVTCKTAEFEERSFSLCEVMADEDLRLFLRDADGEILGTFSEVEETLGEGKLSFAMNAGMFHPDRRPVGLYIEDGKQEATLSDGGGYGNFGLLPNGVFCIGEGLRVWESDAFAAAHPTCRYASQSGPMLVINGALHPRFMADSTPRYYRNGVGTSADGSRAVFVISDARVTFHQFARFFRDYLSLPDALFFDGNVSRLYAPQIGRNDLGAPLGPIVGVVDPDDEGR